MSENHHSNDESTVSKFKNHFVRHKTAYISCCVGLVVGAGVMWLVLREKTIINNSVIADSISESNIFIASRDNIVNQITLPERSIPSKPVQDLTTGTIYASLNEAARSLGIQRYKLDGISADAESVIDDHVFQLLDVDRG